MQADSHSSRHALDWAGAYEGVVACSDCAGIHARLALGEDGRFELAERRLVRGAAPSATRGAFEWEADGNTIALQADGALRRAVIGEGRVQLLEAGQSRPSWDDDAASLAQLPSAWRDGREGLAAVLEDHRWTLVDARNQGNQRIDALFPDGAPPFAFSFEGSRLHARGGCNGLRGSFRIDSGGMLAVTGGMSTMMACDAPLMEADAALAALLAAPLETVLARGAEPTLVLLTEAGDALVLAGELTPEARFGPPATIFLEVAAQAVPCEGSTRADGRCLRVRERVFDEQGLLVEAAADWRTFDAEIEGYRHEPGIRNILRVKVFQPPAGSADAGQPVYVLDLVVQSEVVPE